ncbi:ArfGAP with FG repeats 1, partial [Chytridiales sp. JEL 0842]
FRVKSVGASVFTSEEISKLQSGGNGVAQKIWLGKWSPGAYQPPMTNSNNYTIEEWMRVKYVEKRWYVDPESKQDLNAEVKSVAEEGQKKQGGVLGAPGLSQTADLLGDFETFGDSPSKDVQRAAEVPEIAPAVEDDDFTDFQSAPPPTSTSSSSTPFSQTQPDMGGGLARFSADFSSLAYG